MTLQASVSEDTPTGLDEADVAVDAAGAPARELQADRDVGEQPFTSVRLAVRRPTASELVVGIAAIVAAGAAAAVVLTANAVSHPDGYAFLLALNVLVFVFAGLAWRRARPWSPYGHALIAYGLAVSLYSLGASPRPLVFSIGVLITIPGAFFVWWLILAFPSGRLDSAGRVVFALSGAALLLGCLPKTLLAASMAPVAPLARCNAACPTNPLQIGGGSSLAETFRHIDIGGTAAVSVLIVSLLAVRFRRASRPRKRLLAPVYLFSVLLLVAGGAFQVGVSWLGASPAPSDPFGFAVTAATILFPLGFIAAIVLSHAYVGTALGSMVSELGVSSSLASVERVVQQALDDPVARLAFWLPRARRYVDRHGHHVVLDENDTSTWRSAERTDGEPTLAIVHDAALDEDPELIEAVGAETVLALENRRLQQDLLDSIEALRASRKRLVAVAAAERRKIERDLHDSAQQMLIAIRIQMELTRGQVESGSALDRRLGRIGDDLDRALDELRSVAHGIYPPLLAEEGLADALTEAARRAPVPVELELEDVGRLPEEIETAVYYCCLEALQNAAKHGGPDVAVTMRLWWESHLLRFSVSDDGLGFVPGEHPEPTGLTNMLDRLGAIGGRISIRSAPGRGTDVDGAVTVSP
jgi:signal transduction histidine kinase